MAGPALAVISPTVLAGAPSVVVSFDPAAAAAVPTLSNVAFIALALLLTVVAWRTTRDGSSGRAASLVMFSAALVFGGLGVERSLATSSFSVSTQSDCDNGGTYDDFYPRPENLFTNDCPNAMQITGYAFKDSGNTCNLVPNNGESEPPCGIGVPISPGAKCALRICD